MYCMGRFFSWCQTDNEDTHTLTQITDMRASILRSVLQYLANSTNHRCRRRRSCRGRFQRRLSLTQLESHLMKIINIQ